MMGDKDVLGWQRSQGRGAGRKDLGWFEETKDPRRPCQQPPPHPQQHHQDVALRDLRELGCGVRLKAIFPELLRVWAPRPKGRLHFTSSSSKARESSIGSCGWRWRGRISQPPAEKCPN